jgi:hypothetical protein
MRTLPLDKISCIFVNKKLLNMKRIIAIVFIVLFSFTAFSQDQAYNYQKERKGKLYFYWGWNWGWYGKSCIHFQGENYDFTLDKVSAKDKQSQFSPNIYFNPAHVTIPQYNFRLGYFITDNYNISAGIDHMKYVVQQNQTVKINGYINNTGSGYDGVYEDDNIAVADSFLQFEHTDGLNYINLEFRRYDAVKEWKKVSLNVTEGLGGGVLYPKTNATLLSYERYDDFNVSGFGLSAVLGLNLAIRKFFFVQTEFKAGYINMPDIRTTNYTVDKASQDFFFYQVNIVFGATINLNKKSKVVEK